MGVISPSKRPPAKFKGGDVAETSIKITDFGQFKATADIRKSRNYLKYTIKHNGKSLKFSDVFDLWAEESFVDFYIRLFKEAGYYGYVWETPAISTNSINRDFEFVIHNSPRSSGMPDRKTFASYFDTKVAPEGIVSFENLGHDALLIVPSPVRRDVDYSGMAEFFRNAPIAQQRALWRELGKHAKARLCNKPMWFSVASGGIQWLHLRIDSIPKYYRFEPYTGG